MSFPKHSNLGQSKSNYSGLVGAGVGGNRQSNLDPVEFETPMSYLPSSPVSALLSPSM